MPKVNRLVSLLIVGMSLQNVYADDMSSALQKTQDCLRNQSCDAAKTAEGNAAEQKALNAAGGNTRITQELNNISADIMPILIEQSGGDPAIMQTILMKAQTDPENFLNSLPAEIQTKIRNVTNAVEKNQVPAH